jgi:hypothetical protein
MAYGWCYPYRIYGFWKRDPDDEFERGDITEQEYEEIEKQMKGTLPLEIPADVLQNLGVELHIASVYKNRPTIVYGISINTPLVSEEIKQKIDYASAYIKDKYNVQITTGYHMCVETDLAEKPCYVE